MNRDPYQFPTIDIKKLNHTDFKGIENWFIDKALFVSLLSKFWNQFNYHLGNTVKPEEVVVGKEGWLFLGNNYAATIDQYIGRNRPTNNEIMAKVRVLKHMNQIARQNNIPFLVTIVPDKQGIYPEYLPIGIQPSPVPSRLARLQEKMQENNIDYLDLRQVLQQAKSTLGRRYGALYLEGDSHWNYLGAYAAYQAMTQYFQQKGLITNSLITRFLPNTTTTTDLAMLLQLTNVTSNSPIPDINNLEINIFGKDRIGTTHNMTVFETISNQIILKEPYQVINKALPNKQVCLLIGDSFAVNLEFYFHNDCYNTIRIHADNKMYQLSDLINRYHPDIIVYEKVERNLAHRIESLQKYSENINLVLPSKRLTIYQGQINTIEIDKKQILTKGWVYLPMIYDTTNSDIYLKLSNNSHAYLFTVRRFNKSYINHLPHKKNHHVTLISFNSRILRKDLPNGDYKASLIVINNNLIGEKILSKIYSIY